MTRITDLSLLAGWLPVASTVLGAVGAVWLLPPRVRRYVTTIMPIAVLSAAVLYLWIRPGGPAPPRTWTRSPP